MTKRPQPYNDLTNWDLTAERAAIGAALVPLDKLAAELEGRWGFGGLEAKVSPATAAKFGSAQKRLDAALMTNFLPDIVKRAEVLMKGWLALEAEAKANGHSPGLDRYWSVQGEDGGKPFLFVQHGHDTATAAKAFPDHRVWSMKEVVRVLASHNLMAVLQAKEAFPGAEVVSDRPRKLKPSEMNDPLDDIGETFG